MNGTQKTFVAYVRISRADESRDMSLGLSDQIEKINSFFQNNSNGILLKIFVENGVSAKNIADRPVFNECLDYIRENNVSGIVVNNVTRLSRRLVDVVSLVNNQLSGVQLISLDMSGIDYSSPVGNFILQNMAAVAELERNLIIQRTKLALAQKKKNNETLGRPNRQRFGCLNEGGLLVENPAEKRIIQQVREMRSAGISYAEISKSLAEAGMLNRMGKAFAPSALCKINLAA
jgi:site-specific DNA recombinase